MATAVPQKRGMPLNTNHPMRLMAPRPTGMAEREPNTPRIDRVRLSQTSDAAIDDAERRRCRGLRGAGIRITCV